ncbi:MAG: leucyl aminopeptidase [Acidimicrobiales bacterium]
MSKLVDITVQASAPADATARYVVTANAEGGPKGGQIRPVVDGDRLVYQVGIDVDSPTTAEQVRATAASVIRHHKYGGAIVLDASLFAGVSGVGQALAEGIQLSAYRFDKHRSEATLPKSQEAPSSVVIVVPSSSHGEVVAGIERGTATAKATMLARDLVNEPPSQMTPAIFAGIATEVAEASGLDIRVWDEQDCVRERLGGLLGVARGSVEPPRMIRLHYVPSGAKREGKIGLVGKGITFDSGGLSLKPPSGMETMKTDMSGAAAVLSAMSVLAELACPYEVFGYMALTENMPSGSAQKPGDVLVARNGKTIEVLNTDAEGRLVLADALSLAVEDGCTEIADIATLTGACVVALGDEIGGIMGTSKGLVDTLIEAAARTGEDFWELPLPKKYASHIESEIADMKNMGKAGKAGTLAAALLLKEFVGDTPWAHLDIAGPARADSAKGILQVGATGYGTRTFLEWLTA